MTTRRERYLEMIKKIKSALMHNERGMILPTLIILMTAFTMIGLSLTSYTTSQYSQTKTNVYAVNALQVAEAGIEQSLAQINIDESFTGFTTEQEFFNNSTQGVSKYTTAITPTPDSNAKILTSTAKVYRQSDLANPVSTKKIKVTIVGTNSTGYSVHTGPGGLIIRGNANITNTDVFVNGKLSLSGNSSIGTGGHPVNLKVAHLACPSTANPGPSYPSLCTSGQPISMTTNTSIYGTVCATGQTSTGPNNNIKQGNGVVGLVAGCTAAPVEPPTFDRDAHINSMVLPAVSGASQSCGGNSSKTWSKNIKITGNVTINNNCNLRITGNVYITGNLVIDGNARVTIDNSVSSTRPIIITDGTISITGNTSFIANNLGTGAQFISFKSTLACTTAAPGATCEPTGTDLKNSQELETVTLDGNTSQPGMAFQAYWGKIRLEGNGNMGAAIGQTVDLDANGTVTFGTVLSSGARSWTVTSYQQDFN